MSTNTILIDCNQQQAVAAADAGNPAIWTNKISEGLQLNPGDRVSVSSAFINEVGSGQNTIQFSEANNSATLTLEFYKCADAENCLILPRKWCWTTVAGANADEVDSRPTKYTDPPDVTPYKELYRREHDGARYTIMERYFIAGDPVYAAGGRPLFERHTTTVALRVKTGYNTADNICEQLTQQLHATSAPAAYEGVSISASSPLFKPFVCANDTNYSKANFSTTSKWNPYEFVGMHDPELYLQGVTVGATTVRHSTTDTVTTDWEYSIVQLAKLKLLFAEQARRGDLIFGTDITVNNTRFLHVNKTDPITPLELGNDDDMDYGSGRLFVEFDPSLSESYADGYGFATNDGGYIQFTLTGDKVHSGITVTAGAEPLGTRSIGFDTHFSAYGVDAVLLWSGYEKSQFGDADKLDRVYLGANDPDVSFDTTQSRFVISQLHTARKQINTAEAGKPSTQTDSYPLNPDQGKDIYQINPAYNSSFKFRNIAYNPEVRLTAYDGTAPANNLMKLWTVFDSMTGVFVSDWGVDEAGWSDGMWSKIGYSYADLNPATSTLDRQSRDGTSYPLTSGADVNATQLMQWSVNGYGAPQSTLQLPLFPAAALFGPITVFATSTQLVASTLARQQAAGYWLVRSSLVENPMYLDSRGLSPVIAVIDKSYSSQDYIYMGESTVDFLITAQRTITDIVTSLHLPDGSYASVSDRSAVIYRIIKANNVPLSIIDSFLPKKTGGK